MSNALIKDTRVSYTAGSPGTIGTPGRPAIPAYTSYETQTVCQFGAVTSGNGTWQWVQDQITGIWTYAYFPNPGSTVTTVSSDYNCSVQVVPVYHPAQEYQAPTAGTAPTPAQTSYDYNLGWNAGASSLGFFNGNGFAEWSVPLSIIGAVVGLNDADTDASFVNINFGFMFSSGQARVYENGVQVAFLGAYTDQQQFRIERRGGVVRYYQGGALAYTSGAASIGTVLLDSSLYSGGDYIDSPAIGDLFDILISFQPVTVNGGDVAFAQAALSFLPLTIDSHPFAGAQLTFKPLTLLGGSFYGSTAGYASTTLTVTIPAINGGSVTGTITGVTVNPDGTFSSPIVLTGSGGSVTGTITGTYSSAPDGTWVLNGTITGTDSTGGTVTITIGGSTTGGGSGMLPVNGSGSGTDTGSGSVTATITGAVTGLGASATAGNTSYGAAAIVFEALTIDSHVALPAPPYALGNVVFVPLTMAGLGLSGEIGGTGAPGVPITLRALTVLGSDHPYAEARIALQPLVVGGNALEGNLAVSMGEFVGARAALDAQAMIAVLLDQHGSVTHVFGVQLITSSASGTTPDGGSTGGTGGLGGEGGFGADLSVGDTLTMQQLLGIMLPASASMDAFMPAYGGVTVNSPATVTGTVTGTGTGTGTVIVTGTVIATGTSTGGGVLTGTLTLPLGVTVTGPITGTVTGTVGSDGTFTGTFVGTDGSGNVITGTVTGTVVGDALGPMADGGNTAWIVNWDSAASAKYENYDFTSFAQIGQRYYGVKPDGIYLLEGANDQGFKIRASASFGKLDFGTPNKKRVPHAYMGVSSGGTMYLRVTANGQTFTYAARRSDADMRTQRVDLGKGLVANYIEFELYNHDGCDFELNSVDFAYVELTRRI